MTALASNAISNLVESSKSVVVFYTRALADLETENAHLKGQIKALTEENGLLKAYADIEEPTEVQPQVEPVGDGGVPPKRVRRRAANRTAL